MSLILFENVSALKLSEEKGGKTEIIEQEMMQEI